MEHNAVFTPCSDSCMLQAVIQESTKAWGKRAGVRETPSWIRTL